MLDTGAITVPSSFGLPFIESQSDPIFLRYRVPGVKRFFGGLYDMSWMLSAAAGVSRVALDGGNSFRSHFSDVFQYVRREIVAPGRILARRNRANRQLKNSLPTV